MTSRTASSQLNTFKILFLISKDLNAACGIQWSIRQLNPALGYQTLMENISILIITSL